MVDARQDEALDLFLEMHDYAKVQLEEAQSAEDRSYWQGVKDGLRKCYAVFENDPRWAALCSTGTQQRPPTANDPWRA